MKEFLSQRGVRYAERDVSRDRSAAEEMIRASGQSGVPVVVLDGEVVVGFDRHRLEEVLSRAGREAARPRFGLQVADALKAASRFGVAPVAGALVGKVAAGSPGGKFGLAPGDIITGVNSRPIRSADDLTEALSALRPGDAVAIVFVRDQAAHKSEIVI